MKGVGETADRWGGVGLEIVGCIGTLSIIEKFSKQLKVPSRELAVIKSLVIFLTIGLFCFRKGALSKMIKGKRPSSFTYVGKGMQQLLNPMQFFKTPDNPS